MCDVDDGGEGISQSDKRRARIPHKCCACGETIAAGHVYMRTGSLFDGSWNTYKHCLRCWTMLNAIAFHTDDSVRWTLDCGEIWESPPDEVAALSFALPEEMQAVDGKKEGEP